MFTAKQYRAKAAEERDLLDAPCSPAEASEFRNLKQVYAIVADNEEWLARNADKIVRAALRRPADAKQRAGNPTCMVAADARV
jgi:hypothetical protein